MTTNLKNVLLTPGIRPYARCQVDRMVGMYVAMGCAYRMDGFTVSVVLHRIARVRVVLALAQDTLRPRRPVARRVLVPHAPREL